VDLMGIAPIWISRCKRDDHPSSPKAQISKNSESDKDSQRIRVRVTGFEPATSIAFPATTPVLWCSNRAELHSQKIFYQLALTPFSGKLQCLQSGDFTKSGSARREGLSRE